MLQCQRSTGWPLTEEPLLNTSEKAEIATLKVIIRAIEKGAFVSKPVVEGMRYDLVVDYQGRLHRAQVKYANGSSENGAVFVRPTSSSYGKIRFKGYTAQEVDVILVYVPKLDVILWIDPCCFEGRSNISFRLQPAENNQKKAVAWSKITFGNGFGAIAQLGERYIRIVQARGSSPLSSTK